MFIYYKTKQKCQMINQRGGKEREENRHFQLVT